MKRTAVIAQYMVGKLALEESEELIGVVLADRDLSKKKVYISAAQGKCQCVLRL
jgi:hypothetical protein